MFKFISLYSGSTGNSLFIETDHTKLLIDAGVSAKKITSALTALQTNLNDIDAIIVTHEHSDHTQSLGTLSCKYNIPVFANKETWDAMTLQRDKISTSNQKNFSVSEKFEIGELTIEPFSIPHDAANPCGFNLFCQKEKMSIATDLGHMTTPILKKLEGSSFLMLESNYDPEILKCCSYPYRLKTRIAGPNGHLPNELAGKTISYLLKSGLKDVLLGHLSKENNFPELAYKTVLDELIQNNFDENSIHIGVASRLETSKTIEIVS